MNLKERVISLYIQIDNTIEEVETCKRALEKIEEHVAGENAAIYRASRLLNTANSALEEANAWLKGIK